MEAISWVVKEILLRKQDQEEEKDPSWGLAGHFILRIFGGDSYIGKRSGTGCSSVGGLLAWHAGSPEFDP